MIQPTIHEAARDGDVEKLKQFLKRNPADVDSVDKSSCPWTPLFYVARANELEAAKVLIDHKATIDKKDIYGATAMHVAAQNDSKEVLAFLLDNGADIHALDSDGESALMRAVYRNKLSCVKLLLERKADLTMRAKSGRFLRKNGELEYSLSLLPELWTKQRWR